METSPASSGQYGQSWPKCSAVDGAPFSAGRESAAGGACTMCDAWDMPSVCGIVLAALAYLGGAPLLVVPGALLAGAFGLPRWFVSFARKRRVK